MSKSFGRATLVSLAALTLGVALAQEPNPAGCDEDGRGWGRRALACDVRKQSLGAGVGRCGHCYAAFFAAGRRPNR